jgi:hypothetical protein
MTAKEANTPSLEGYEFMHQGEELQGVFSRGWFFTWFFAVVVICYGLRRLV